MNRSKLIHLLMATAVVTVAWASTASAATPTSPAGTTYEGKLHASSEGHAVIHNSIAKIECASTLEGEVEGSGFSGPASIPLSSLTFTGCTNSWHATVVSPGTLSVHAVSGGNNGTITSSGMTIRFVRFGAECLYKTESTDIGTLTASKATGGTATIDLSGELIRHGGSALCGGSTAKFTGGYSVGTPDYLDVDQVLGSIPTSPAGTAYTGKLHASSEGHVTIHNPIANIQCASTLEGEVEGSGFSGSASIPLSSLTFTGCTNEWHVTVISPGTLEIHPLLGSNNGTVTWSGATIEATRFGVTCLYKAEGADIGTLTGSKAAGGTATIDLSGSITFHSGSGLCGSGAASFTGSYSVGTPDYLDVDAVLGYTPTSPAGTSYTGKLHASSEGHVTIHNPIANIQCSSTLEGEVEIPSSGDPIAIPLGSLTFTGCTNSWHVTVISPGTLEIHPIAGNSNGTVTWSGATIAATRFGPECLYKTEATHIGTLTGSKVTGATATIDLSGELIRHGGSALCGGSTAKFTGGYSVGTPDYLDVDLELG
jgi:hypothetical protein